jgi:heme-degrading monooxygenase HmoA
MTVVKINAITVPSGSGDELARRFATRAGAVDDAPAPVSSASELWGFEVVDLGRAGEAEVAP